MPDIRLLVSYAFALAVLVVPGPSAAPFPSALAAQTPAARTLPARTPGAHLGELTWPEAEARLLSVRAAMAHGAYEFNTSQ